MPYSFNQFLIMRCAYDNLLLDFQSRAGSILSPPDVYREDFQCHHTNHIKDL